MVQESDGSLIHRCPEQDCESENVLLQEVIPFRHLPVEARREEVHCRLRCKGRPGQLQRHRTGTFCLDSLSCLKTSCGEGEDESKRQDAKGDARAWLPPCLCLWRACHYSNSAPGAVTLKFKLR